MLKINFIYQSENVAIYRDTNEVLAYCDSIKFLSDDEYSNVIPQIYDACHKIIDCIHENDTYRRELEASKKQAGSHVTELFNK
ncbi:hypothetical protein HQ585_11580 [candidate division KSB1 bacterium]|nr:hypothetical protein [candidate division KSB1 bacterium]